MKTIADADDIPLGELDERRQHPDRRKSARRKVLKRGRTYWLNGDSSECIVVNLSDGGAHLDIRGSLPDRFDLVVDGYRWCRSCVVVSRKMNHVGVKFEGQSTLIPSRPIQRTDEFRRYIDVCRILANRVAARTDQELLLEMAEAWTVIIRRLARLQPNN